MSAHKIVYSTDSVERCQRCGHPVAICRCAQDATAPAGDGIVRVRLDRKGRRGKAVTTITGVPLDAKQLRALAGELKKLCGCGGAIKDGVIEIQGDQRDRLVAALEQRDFRVKRAGG